MEENGISLSIKVKLSLSLINDHAMKKYGTVYSSTILDLGIKWR
jgi:hypothetical protein